MPVFHPKPRTLASVLWALAARENLRRAPTTHVVRSTRNTKFGSVSLRNGSHQHQASTMQQIPMPRPRSDNGSLRAVANAVKRTHLHSNTWCCRSRMLLGEVRRPYQPNYTVGLKGGRQFGTPPSSESVPAGSGLFDSENRSTT